MHRNKSQRHTRESNTNHKKKKHYPTIQKNHYQSITENNLHQNNNNKSQQKYFFSVNLRGKSTMGYSLKRQKLKFKNKRFHS